MSRVTEARSNVILCHNNDYNIEEALDELIQAVREECGVPTLKEGFIVGTVSWFNDAKGFGFIAGSDDNTYFVHYSTIKVDGYKTLKENQKVQFKPCNASNGLAAEEVYVLE